MNGSQRMTTWITFTIVAAVLVIVLSIQGCYKREDFMIYKMVQEGSSPMEATCAIAPARFGNSMCARFGD